MPIVFDQVEGVVQRSPDDMTAGADGAADAAAPPAGADPEILAEQMDRIKRRKDRLIAD
ncbi:MULTISPECIES: hypothetical protein [Sorangium]|uniref:Uncharacterized protein n=1 Tax=Sorangium cellulosum TaxID=56 RepID=A0A4P2R356_SORCE|nr:MULTISPECIES: hypothetical protein [Sorangium]AUX37467.1 uncharacterized protein SOCE836_096920 [Sorangium cellulosum]WCQ96758.1 hypothetical protein NQZ70_09545 [Sorangium sp. Soce836]